MERLEKPDKHWKFNFGDLKERALWSDYQRVFEDMLQHTSTKWAPWWVVPGGPQVGDSGARVGDHHPVD